MHPDEYAMRRQEESERRMFEREQWCQKCGDRRIQRNGRWVCLVCETRGA